MSIQRIKETALTFDDLLLVPRYSEVTPVQVITKTVLSLRTDLNLQVPIISAAMDTVTEEQMAITIASLGGLGILHRNQSPSIQAQQVRRVKRFESGIVRDPATTRPDTKITELRELTAQLGISGMPVVTNTGELVGIITSRDFRDATDTNSCVKDLMTSRDQLVTVKEGAPQEEATALMHRHRIEKVLVVNEVGNLSGLITRKDIEKMKDMPLATQDKSNRLVVGAAVGVGTSGIERAEQLVEQEVDVLAVDSAHGHSKNVIDIIKTLRAKFPQVAIIGGNVATVEGATALADAGADAIKIGIGPGSICTTRVVTGVGMPQVTAVLAISEALKGRDISVICDGGLRYSGDIAKALACGASAVMLGGMLAGTTESPGQIELYRGRAYKAYRGMGSIGAMGSGQSADRYSQDAVETDKLVPEGIEGRVPYKGQVGVVIHQIAGGLKAAMGYLGAADIDTLHQVAEFVQITTAGQHESHVHNVTVTKEPPNYQPR